MYKKCLLIVFCLFAISFVHAQKNNIGNDSLYIYSSLFSKYLDAEDNEKAIYYGEKFMEEYDKRGLEKYSTYWNIIENLAVLYFSSGNINETLKLYNELLPTKKDSYGENSSEYAKSLYVLEYLNSKLGNYSEAIRLASEASIIQRKVLGPEHPDYALSLSDLAQYNSFLGNYTDAIRFGTEAMEIRRKVLGPEHPDYASSLSNLASYISALGNYSEAIRLETKAMEIHKKVFGTDNSDYATLLFNISNYYAVLGNFPEAIHFGTESMTIFRNVLGPEHSDYAMALNYLANYHFNLGNYTEAIRFGTEAMEIRRKVLGPEHSDYASSLHNLASYISARGNYSEAIRLETKAMEIHKKVFGPEHLDYALSLGNLASYYSHLGNDTVAIRLGTESMNVYKRVLGPEHPDYATSLNNLASYQFNLGNYLKAIQLATEAMEIRRKVFGPEHLNYATSLNNLAKYQFNLNNYPKAIQLATEAMEIRRNVLGPEHPDYATSLSNLANFYSYLGKISEAMRLATEAMEIRRKVLGPEHPDYATSLSNLAGCNSELGNYNEAMRLEMEALEIRRKFLGPEHPDYATSLSNLAHYNSSLGNHSEAIRLGKEAMEIRRKVRGIDHPDYATSLSSLAHYNSSLGNYDSAFLLGTVATEFLRNSLGTKHLSYAVSLHNLANYYCYLSNFSVAIRLGAEAMEIFRTILGPEHPDYASSLSNLAGYNYSLGNYSESYIFFVQAMKSSHDFILSNFSELSSGFQESLWSYSNSDKFNSFFPSLVFRFQTDESISELYDMTALFAKGILLNTGIEIRKLILESGDLSLVARYDALASDKSIYDKQMEKPISDRAIDMDSLRSVINRKEMELARDSKAYGDFSRNLRITWRDVQEKLDDDDLAVEFLDFLVYGTDSTMYVALTLRKDYDFPRMIPLFEKSQLDSVPEGSLYTDTSLYDLVWKPLESELSGVKAIYFSPSGELHRLGIEYVPVTPTENICDRYNLHRLSSTRQLAVIRDGVEGEGGVLYGGLDYNAVTDKGPTVTEGENGTRSYRYVPRANVDSLDLRGTLSYLPSTKEEVERIASNMRRNNVSCTNYMGKTGTEESFKQLDGTRPRILHIATHGFFMTEEEAKDKHFARPILQEGETSYREDKPMTRSGLLLSGCRPALNHETIPDGEEDGILTAQEISELDLRGLDLVVLSACQTGLGDIVSGEGVFGLQRGFKNAGVRTIVMSLWKVDDNATLDLMVRFYKHYLGGKTKEEAFRLAREELRRKSQPGKIRPDWAAFVMLDGE